MLSQRSSASDGREWRSREDARRDRLMAELITTALEMSKVKLDDKESSALQELIDSSLTRPTGTAPLKSPAEERVLILLRGLRALLPADPVSALTEYTTRADEACRAIDTLLDRYHRDRRSTYSESAVAIRKPDCSYLAEFDMALFVFRKPAPPKSNPGAAYYGFDPGAPPYFSLHTTTTTSTTTSPHFYMDIDGRVLPYEMPRTVESPREYGHISMAELRQRALVGIDNLILTIYKEIIAGPENYQLLTVGHPEDLAAIESIRTSA